MGKGSRREGRRKRVRRDGPRKEKRSLRDLLPPDLEILAVILLLALALRMWFAYTYDATLYDQHGEGIRYLGQLKGGVLDTESPPLYVLFLRLCLAIFGRGAAKAAFVVKGLAGTLSVALIYYIAREISDRTTAVVSAAVSAVYVNYMMVALALSPRVPGILVLFVATLVMMRAGGRARGEGIAGAVLGLGVLVDPFLLLYVPGFLLISRRRLFFTAALLVVVTPWTVRNSVMEGTIVPVYAPSAIELDLSRWVIRCPADFYRLVDKTYVNAAGLVSRGAGWIQPAGSETSEAIRNSTTFGAYFYLVVALGGLVGVLRHHSSRHGPFLRPALIYLGILVLFSTARNTNRLLAEHIAIFYSALLLVWIARWLRSRRESTPARSGRGDVAGRSYG